MSNFSKSVFSVLLFYGLLWSLSGCFSPPQSGVDEPPQITKEEKKQVLEQIDQQRQKLNLCNQERDIGLSDESTKVYIVSPQKYVVEILCFLGAYQGNYQYLLVSQQEKEITKINFATFIRQEEELKLSETNTLVGLIEFDDLNQILTIKAKARGLGDCGSYAQYQWQNSSFELKEYRDKYECDGVYVEPENYPLIYP